MDRTTSRAAGQSRKNRTCATGYYVSVLTVAVASATFGIAVLTPPLSGPFCAGECFEYPYTAVASRFPRDYLWMYPGTLVPFLLVAMMACIREYAPREKKVFGQMGLSFAVISATILSIAYFTQISVMQPSLMNREFDGIPIWSQYNPHGIFIALEELGYLAMALSFFGAAPVFSARNRLETAARWTFSAGFPLAVLSLAAISLGYGIHREYRFEVAVITIDFTVLIVSGVLLGLIFRRGIRENGR